MDYFSDARRRAMLVVQGESCARVNTAKVVWREEKLGQLQVSAEELQPLRFQGQFIDQETGLHYNRFRYLDPDLGMFTTRDPIGLMGGVNTFQYAPNPTGWIDPFGLWGEFMNGAQATISTGDFRGTFQSSPAGHAEINGLNSLLSSGGLKGKDVVISDVTGVFNTGNKPVGVCSNCRLNIFGILRQGEARSITIPETRGNQVIGQITIDASDFSKVEDALSEVDDASRRVRSDKMWKILRQHSKCTKGG